MKQDVVVNLFGVPLIMIVLGIVCVLPGCLVEPLVLLRAEPRTMHDLPLRPIGRGEIVQMR